MWRVQTAAQAELIGEALSFVPERLRALADESDWFCGDPWFAGIHDETESGSGNGVTRTHACPSRLTCDDRNVIVLGPEADLAAAVHEIGHVLEWALLARWPDFGPYLEFINPYSRTCWPETFAEAWVQWLYPPEWVEKIIREGANGHRWERWSRWNCEVFDRLMLDSAGAVRSG